MMRRLREAGSAELESPWGGETERARGDTGGWIPMLPFGSVRAEGWAGARRVTTPPRLIRYHCVSIMPKALAKDKLKGEFTFRIFKNIISVILLVSI